MNRSATFTAQNWLKQTERTISPPIEIDIPGKVPFEQIFEDLMRSFANQYCMEYVPVDRISTSKAINESPEIKKLLNSKIGLQAVVTCLEHQFTLVVPSKTMTLTPEYLITHMIKKHLNENTFVTFNGLYGKWSEDSIALKSRAHN